MKLCWLDIRNVNGAKEAMLEEAVHQRVDAVVAADPADLETLPPTVKKVLFPQNLPKSGVLAQLATATASGPESRREISAPTCD